MTSKMKLITSIYLVSIVNLYSQSLPMVRYTTDSQLLETISSFEIDTLKTSDFTNWNYGLNIDREYLPQESPDSTYNGSGFTDFYPVQNFYNINKYPIRTAVKIFRIVNDTLKQRCSGILVAKNYVLTDCHCIGEYDSLRNFIFEDSTYIYPAYDNGIENPIWGNSSAIEFITFKENMIGRYKKDIALIKLNNEVGLQTGWIGIAFNEDDTFFEENLFHKFSYPGVVDFTDSTRVYNGDTLYYNYGGLDLIDREELGYGVTGIPGQSGSSLFYTDNEEYSTFGTQVWSHNSRHIRIDRQIFYSFNSILDSVTTAVENPDLSIIEDYNLSNAYPNPFNSSTTIIYSIQKQSYVTLKVYDGLGREVQTLINKELSLGKYKVQFNASDLSSGVYFYRLQAGNFVETKKMLLLK